MISKVNISNFKSIKSLYLDCKKINIFIGKPNVGKSNILECLSFFGASDTTGIRLETTRNLFYDLDIENVISIQVDDFFHFIRYDFDKDSYSSYMTHYDKLKSTPLITALQEHMDERISPNANIFKRLGQKGDLSISMGSITEQGVFRGEFNHGGNLPKIKKYTYRKPPDHASNIKNSTTLAHPFGENIFSVLKNNTSLLHEVSELFKEYGYSLVIDYVTNEAEIQKIVGNVSYKIPYSLVADTLKRVVFYLTAIRMNRDCAILLEEPESHSFPPYIRDIAFEIIDSPNQFFIATHSPYLLNTIISEAKAEDISINIVSYADFKTEVKTMTPEEISELSNYGIDLFFNLNIFSK